MDSLLERLIGLLGASIGCPSFEAFLEEYNESPLTHETKRFHTYNFQKSGFNIMTDKRQDQIKMLFIELNTAGVRSGQVAPFSETLPFGILPDDDRETVKEKVGVERISQKMQGRTPTDPEDFYDRYKFLVLDYAFVFSGEDEQLSLISVIWTVDVVPEKPRSPLPYELIENEFSPGMQEAIKFAKEEARSLRHLSVGSEFLLLGLMANSNNIAAMALASMGLRIENVRSEVRKIVGTGEKGVIYPQYTPGAQVVLEEALAISREMKSQKIKEEHCLLSIIDNKGVGRRTLQNLGVDFQRLEDGINRLIKKRK